ncbi:MAG: hypothetical protein K2I90_11270, partial [Odoribacter sp.]|nr:hypothetical protein [Odoribacter sp.]
MKMKFLFLLLFASLFMPATAQQFKHFKVDTTAEMWRLSSIAGESSQEGFASQARFPYINMIDLVKNTVQGFPGSIRKKLAEQQDVRLYLTFNGRGEVY